eukprot:scaffold90387_cov48-Phaeocystis_antarctica.AAC.2
MSGGCRTDGRRQLSRCELPGHRCCTPPSRSAVEAARSPLRRRLPAAATVAAATAFNGQPELTLVDGAAVIAVNGQEDVGVPSSGIDGAGVALELTLLLLDRGVPLEGRFSLAEPLAESLGQAEQLRRHHRHPDDDGGAHDRPALRGHRVDVAEADGGERGEPEVERGEEVGDVLVHRVLRLVDATGGDEDERQERRADARQLQLVRPHVGLLDADGQLEALERLRVL